MIKDEHIFYAWSSLPAGANKDKIGSIPADTLAEFVRRVNEAHDLSLLERRALSAVYNHTQDTLTEVLVNAGLSSDELARLTGAGFAVDVILGD